MAFDLMKFLTGKSISDVYVDSNLVSIVSEAVDDISKKKIEDVRVNLNSNLKELNRLNGVDKIGSCPRIDDFNTEFDNLVNAVQDIKTELNRKKQIAEEYSENNGFHINFKSILGTSLTGLALTGEGFFSGIETAVDMCASVAGWVGLLDSQKSKDFVEKEHVKDFFNPFYETEIAKSSLIKRDSFLAGCAYIQGRAASVGNNLFSLVISALSGNKTSKGENDVVSVKKDNHLNADVGSSHTDSEDASSINNKSSETINNVERSIDYSNNKSNHSNIKSKSNFTSYKSSPSSKNVKTENNTLTDKKIISGIDVLDLTDKKAESSFEKSAKKGSNTLKTTSISSSIKTNNSDIFNSKNNSLSDSSSGLNGNNNVSTLKNESDNVLVEKKVLLEKTDKKANFDSNTIHHTGGGYSETAGFDGVERLEDVNSSSDNFNLNESISNATTSIDDIIKGNHSTKIPTSSFISSSKTGGSVAVPIASGLSAAAAVGVGTGSYMIKNNNLDKNDESIDVEDWNEKVDLDISDVGNKEDNNDENPNKDDSNKISFDMKDIEELSEI